MSENEKEDTSVEENKSEELTPKQVAFNEQIWPLLEKAHALCAEFEIPFFFEAVHSETSHAAGMVIKGKDGKPAPGADRIIDLRMISEGEAVAMPTAVLDGMGAGILGGMGVGRGRKSGMSGGMMSALIGAMIGTGGPDCTCPSCTAKREAAKKAEAVPVEGKAEVVDAETPEGNKR